MAIDVLMQQNQDVTALPEHLFQWCPLTGQNHSGIFPALHMKKFSNLF
jgi:hypothetical protein